MTSPAAQRIQSLNRHFHHLMRHPVAAPGEIDLYAQGVLDKARTEAFYYITHSTLDLDFLGFLSREKAAGRTYSSELLARSVFSQAGVVAPPESLNPETLHVLGQGH